MASVSFNLPNSHPRTILSEYEIGRWKFAKRVYGLTLIFICLTIAQWIPLVLTDICRKPLQRYHFLSYAAAIIGLCSLIAYANFPECRKIFPYDWITSIVIVECLAFGFFPAFVLPGMALFAYTLGATLCVSLLFTIMGKVMKHDMTEDIILIGVVTLLLFSWAIVFIVIFFITTYFVFEMCFCVLGIVIMLMFTIYHSQIIFGGRSAQFEPGDYLMAAVVAYVDFIILFVLIISFGTSLYGMT